MNARQITFHSLLLLLFVVLVPVFAAGRLLNAMSGLADVETAHLEARVQTEATGGIPVAVNVLHSDTLTQTLPLPVQPA